MTTGRINQVTTDDRSQADAATVHGRLRSALETSRTQRRVHGRPRSLRSPPTTGLANPPADPTWGACWDRPAGPRGGTVNDGASTQTRKKDTVSHRQRRNLATHDRGPPSTAGRHTSVERPPRPSGTGGYDGSAALRLRDVRDGLQGSPVAPQLKQRHRRVGTGAGSFATSAATPAPQSSNPSTS